MLLNAVTSITSPTKEFIILKVLMSNPGHVIGRDTIIDRVGAELQRRH